MSHETYEILLMKAVDNRLSPEEAIQWQKHLESCEECRQEWQDFRSIKDTTDALRQRILSQAELAPIQDSYGSKQVHQIGWILLFLGWILGSVLAGWAFLTDPTTSFWEKLSMGLIGGGTLILFSSVLYRRLRDGSRDPYKQIEL